MVRAGLRLPPEHLALACASHSGEPSTSTACATCSPPPGSPRPTCRTPPTCPIDADERDGWIRARAARPARSRRTARASTPRCSPPASSTAGTLPPTATPTHPLAARDRRDPRRAGRRAGRGHRRRRLRRARHGRHARRAGPGVRPDGLRRAPAPPRPRSPHAMRAHPEYVGGTGRDVTALIRAHPGPDRQGRRRGRVRRRAGRRPRASPSRSPTARRAPAGRPGRRAAPPRRRVDGVRAARERPGPGPRRAGRRDRRGRLIRELSRGAGRPAAGLARRVTVDGEVVGSDRPPRAARPRRRHPRRRRRAGRDAGPQDRRPADPARRAVGARRGCARCSSSASSPSTPTPARADGRRGTPQHPARSPSRSSTPSSAALRERGVEVADRTVRRRHAGRARQRRPGDDPARRLTPTLYTMSSLAQLQSWIVLGLSVVALGVEVYALVDCVRRRSDALRRGRQAHQAVLAARHGGRGPPRFGRGRRLPPACSPSSPSSRQGSTSPTSSRPSTR